MVHLDLEKNMSALTCGFSRSHLTNLTFSSSPNPRHRHVQLTNSLQPSRSNCRKAPPFFFPSASGLRPVHGGGRGGRAQAPAVAPPPVDGAVQAVRRRLLRLPRRRGPSPAPGLPPGPPLQAVPDPPHRQARAPPLPRRGRGCRGTPAPSRSIPTLAPPLPRPHRFVLHPSGDGFDAVRERKMAPLTRLGSSMADSMRMKSSRSKFCFG
jgi:hypothetical protein